jgi:hypothetical protein
VEVRVAEEVELVVEPGRVQQLEPLNLVIRGAATAAAQLATAGTPKRCER